MRRCALPMVAVPMVALPMVAVLASPVALVAQDSVWTIEPEPTVAIGAGVRGPADQFGLVIAARRLADGSIAVLEGFTQSVRVYDVEGRHLRDIGGPGDGPGELRGAMDLEVVGDTVVVLEEDGGRTWYAASSGSVLRSEPPSVSGLCAEDYKGRADGLLSDATLMVRCEQGLFGRVDGEYRQTVGLLRADGRPAADSLGWFPADTGRTDAGDVPVPRPYLPRAELLWAGHGDQVFIATGDIPRIHVIGGAGGARVTWPAPVTGRPTRPEDIEAEVEDGLRMIGNENDRRVVTEWYEGMPRSARTPAMKRLLAPSADELWIETWESGGGGSGAVWVVLDGAGGLRARLVAPSGLRVVEVGPDWVLGIWRDEYGIELVRVHALARG